MKGLMENRPVPRSRPLPRFRRSSEAPPCLLQERDLALLRDLWRYRCLTTSQLEVLRSCDPEPTLRFVSRLTLTRRLKLLFHGGYLRRLARPTTGGMQEPVYLLDKEGARVLSQRYGEVTARAPSQLPKLPALEHLLAINEVRIALAARTTRADSDPGTRLLAWQGSGEARFTVTLPPENGKAHPAARNATVRKVSLLPDGFFILKPPKMKLFYYLEVDLGSEAGRVLTAKCQAYYAFWQSGGFGERHGVEERVGFRVLFVAPTEKRVQTMLQSISRLDAGQGLFWVALQNDITPSDILRPIWRSNRDSTRLFSLLGHTQPIESGIVT
jgi:hypothetical protein